MIQKIEKSITKDRIIGTLISLGLLIHLYFNISIITSGVKNPTTLDVINSFIALITLSLIVLASFVGLFLLVTKDAHAVEKWALRNLTQVCYFILIMLGVSYIQKYITIDQLLTGTGATVVFWYGYKKYERATDIEQWKTFQKESGDLKNPKDANINYLHILELWENYYSLYKNNYISPVIWSYIVYDIEVTLKGFMEKDFDLFCSKFEGSTFFDSYEQFISDYFDYTLTSEGVLGAHIVFLESRDGFYDTIAKFLEQYFKSHRINNDGLFKKWKNSLKERFPHIISN